MGRHRGAHHRTGNSPGARIYKADIMPDWCVRLGAEGKSEAQMAAEMGVTRRNLRVWGKTHPEFGEALEYAADLALAWWESKGQKSLTRQGFNTSLYNKIISSRFRREYSDRILLGGDADAPLVTRIERIIRRPDAS